MRFLDPMPIRHISWQIPAHPSAKFIMPIASTTCRKPYWLSDKPLLLSTSFPLYAIGRSGDVMLDRQVACQVWEPTPTFGFSTEQGIPQFLGTRNGSAWSSLSASSCQLSSKPGALLSPHLLHVSGCSSAVTGCINRLPIISEGRKQSGSNLFQEVRSGHLRRSSQSFNMFKRLKQFLLLLEWLLSSNCLFVFPRQSLPGFP